VCQVLSTPSSTDYLQSLVELAIQQPGGLDIATLNYDTTVESVADRLGVHVDTGMSRWRPGEPIDFSLRNQTINLMKIHGSVNWSRSTDNRNRPEGFPFVQHVYVDGADPLTNENPVIIIGDREKLTAEGPTLALMRAFEEALARADRLVVVGYSFGDDHINTVIRNWLGARSSPTLTILDPGWPDPVRRVAGPETVMSFRDALRFVAGYSLTQVDGRILVIKQSASDGLQLALEEVPLTKRTTEISIVACLDEQPYLMIANHGYELDYLDISALPTMGTPLDQSIVNLRTDLMEPGSTHVRLLKLGKGLSTPIYFDALSGGRGFGSLWLSGSNWRSTLSEHVVVTLQGAATNNP